MRNVYVLPKSLRGKGNIFFFKQELPEKEKVYYIRKEQSIQWNSTLSSSHVKFQDEPLSNIDIMRWIGKLGVSNLRGIYFRDNLPSSINNKECGIINLNTQIGTGTHWVCYRNVEKNYCEYFDSFGLGIPKEIEQYLTKRNRQIIYSGDEIQERSSVLCGYWCLYYLLERQRGTSLFDTIHNPSFDMNNQMVNKEFLISYFSVM